MIPHRQTTFTGGEVSAALYGRTDFGKHSASLRTCRNFIPTVQGAALNRPGTAYGAEVKDSTKKVRLVPFQYSETQTFIIELGDLYMRFHTSGAPVLATGSPAWSGATTYALDAYVTSGGLTYRSLQAANLNHAPASSPTWWVAQSVLEYVTPWAVADLPRLKFSQSGDIVNVTHQSYQPRQIKRLSNISWQIAVAPDVFKDIGGHTAFANGVGGITVSGVDTAGDATHPPRAWYWVVSVIRSDGRECWDYPAFYDSVATAVAMYTDRAASKANLAWTAVAGALGYRIYRGAISPAGTGNMAGWIAALFTSVISGERGPAGLVGTVGASASVFTDIGTAPDYSQQAPVFTDPYPTASDYPAASTYFDQRRVLAGSVNGPGRVRASKVADYGNFDAQSPALASDAVDLTLASLKREEIRSLLPGRQLFALTGSAIWAISGANFAPLTPTSIEARPRVQHGASWLDPLAMNDAFIFVQEKGGVVRDVAFSTEAGGYPSRDLSILARHLFQGLTITDWTYARDPYSTVWAVRSDGVLLGLTYVRDQDIWGWSRHDTDGLFENVCAVAEGSEDFVYVVVNRTVQGVTRRYVERFASRIVSNVKKGTFVDAALSYDGTKIDTWTLNALSGSTPGSTGTLNSVAYSFVAGDVGKEVRLNATGAAPVRAKIKSGSGLAVAVELITPSPSAVSVVSTDNALASTTLTGLSHLEQKTVMVLGDGASVGSFTVTAGAITLPIAVALATVGLAYVSDLETLDLAIQGQELRALNKIVRRMSFEVDSARELSTGEDFSNLTPWAERVVADSYGTMQPMTALVEVNINSTWGKSGRGVIRHSSPFPISVLSVIREVEPSGS